MNDPTVQPPPAVPRVASDNPIPASWADHVIEEAAAPAPARAMPPGVDLHLGVEEFRACEVIDVEERNGRPARKECAGCGAKVKPGDAPHAAVARVVRPGHQYGTALSKPGQVVYVELAQLSTAVLEATMSLAEWRQANVSAAEARARAEAPKTSRISELVQQGFEQVSKATRAEIEKARERILHEREMQLAEARALAGDKPQPDHEGAHQPTRPVEGAGSER
jgi:hypothetical protein